MTFRAAWLTLREPADIAARSSPLAARIAALLERREEPVSAVDLGAGTGSNLRYLAPRIAGDQEWLLVDNDPMLLGQVPVLMFRWSNAFPGRMTEEGGAWVVSVRERTYRILTCVSNLNTLDPAWFERRMLVTASALLDLVSAEWLERLVSQCTGGRAVALFALTYDGRIECRPRDADDEMIRTLVNRHQQRDKGFGQALGPDAASVASQLFENAGYSTDSAQSDWKLGAESAQLQRELLTGWAQAATEVAPDESGRIDEWLLRRLSLVDNRQSQVIVGHTDLAGWPSTG